MSRTATGAVFLSALAALIVGPELGFGPITTTSRADARPHAVPQATVVVLVPPFIPQPAAVPAPPARAAAPPRPAATVVATGDVWARLRACESPTNGGARY